MGDGGKVGGREGATSEAEGTKGRGSEGRGAPDIAKTQQITKRGPKSTEGQVKAGKSRMAEMPSDAPQVHSEAR